jgi:hypothetical protein
MVIHILTIFREQHVSFFIFIKFVNNVPKRIVMKFTFEFMEYDLLCLSLFLFLLELLNLRVATNQLEIFIKIFIFIAIFQIFITFPSFFFSIFFQSAFF